MSDKPWAAFVWTGIACLVVGYQFGVLHASGVLANLVPEVRPAIYGPLDLRLDPDAKGRTVHLDVGGCHIVQCDDETIDSDAATVEMQYSITHSQIHDMHLDFTRDWRFCQ